MDFNGDMHVKLQCTMNRAGAIPVIQQISGALRILIGVVTAIVGAIIGAFEFTFFEQDNTSGFKLA